MAPSSRRLLIATALLTVASGAAIPARSHAATSCQEAARDAAGAEESPEKEIVVRNETAEPQLQSLSLAESVGADANGVVLTDLDSGACLGTWRDTAVLELPPFSMRRIGLTAAEPSTEGGPTGFQITLILPTEDRRSAEVQHVDRHDPALAEKALAVLARSGAVIANHHGTALLETLPLQLAAQLIPRVIPLRATSTRPAKSRSEERVTLQSARAAWQLNYPTRAMTESVWLACPEIGFFATPIQPVIADGFPCASGFVINTQPGVVLVTMDLNEREMSALSRRLSEESERLKLIRICGEANYAVRASGEPGGRFDSLALDPTRPEHLIPADPYLTNKWSALPPGGSKRSLRTLRLPSSGALFTEEALHFQGAFSLAIDVPTSLLPDRRAKAKDEHLRNPTRGPYLEDELIVVVRRAAQPEPRGESGDPGDPDAHGYTLQLGAIRCDPLSNPTDDGWKDDVFRVPGDAIGSQQRILLSLVTTGGAIDVARIAFFLHQPKIGTPLRLVRHTFRARGEEGASPIVFDRAPDGGLLETKGRSWLTGASLPPDATLELELDAPFLSLLARVAMDLRSPAEARASLRVLGDGRELHRTEMLGRDDPPASIAVDLRGVKQITLQVVSDDATIARSPLLDLLEPRLIQDH